MPRPGTEKLTQKSNIYCPIRRILPRRQLQIMKTVNPNNFSPPSQHHRTIWTTTDFHHHSFPVIIGHNSPPTPRGALCLHAAEQHWPSVRAENLPVGRVPGIRLPWKTRKPENKKTISWTRPVANLDWPPLGWQAKQITSLVWGGGRGREKYFVNKKWQSFGAFCKVVGKMGTKMKKKNFKGTFKI